MNDYAVNMMYIVTAVGICYGVYIPWKKPTDVYGKRLRLTFAEWAAALLVIAPIVSMGVSSYAINKSVSNQLKYVEFYNGVETSATRPVNTCRPGYASNDSAATGKTNCRYKYNCGTYPYEVRRYDHNEERTVTHHYEAVIECPYVTMEYTHRLTDSLGGEYQVGRIFADYTPIPWNKSVAIPADVPTGSPAEWLESRKRLNAKDPRPVTREFEYDNFILAAKEDLILPYSDDIDRYLDQGILPYHTVNIHGVPTHGYNDSIASKMTFLGVNTPESNDEWQEALNGLNGALGMTLRGDVHIVAIDAKSVDSKVNYTNALKAYWISDAFGNKSIAKNAIVIVLGVEDGHVKWAEASTGMPYGNEIMLERLSGRFGRENVPFTPLNVIGNPVLLHKNTSEDKSEPYVVLAESPGVIESVILDEHPFARASMECNDDDDGELCLGFGDLVDKIDPSRGAVALMYIVAAFFAMFLWYKAAVYDWFGFGAKLDLFIKTNPTLCKLRSYSRKINK